MIAGDISLLIYYLSTSLSKVLPNSKTIKSAKKFSILGIDPCHLSNILQTHIFLSFDNISENCLICKINNNPYHEKSGINFPAVFRKRPVP